MNARVVTARLKPNKVDEAVSQYRSSVVPAAKRQKGYRGKLLFLNRDTHEALSITLWETRGDMLASESSGYLESQFRGLGDLFAEPPTTEHYEVSVGAQAALTHPQAGPQAAEVPAE